MTVQWTLVAAFLYSEIALITFLLLPFISPKVWKSFFSSRFCQTFASKANLYFTILIAILVLFFLDSIREMNKYSTSLETEHMHLDADMQLRLKLFRSQRNFYIAGFALFLWLVIRRFIVLTLSQANLMCELEVTMRQAQSVTDRVESLMREQQEKNEKRKTVDDLRSCEKKASEIKLTEVHNLLSRTEDELKSVKIDLIAVKQKASAVSFEYDYLLQEHNTLREKYNITKDSGDKKKD